MVLTWCMRPIGKVSDLLYWLVPTNIQSINFSVKFQSKKKYIKRFLFNINEFGNESFLFLALDWKKYRFFFLRDDGQNNLEKIKGLNNYFEKNGSYEVYKYSLVSSCRRILKDHFRGAKH